ncbi:MAG: 2-oxoacid:acceptor oxidoreductase family protein [Candidatus Omnitrophica bacterium]|nr:2-oxoacid:acceptor oxidoreductase family protein [Candidatus Omnitrophota bacterium]
MKKKTNRQTEEILSAGFGGQGIMFMGKLFAAAGLAAGRFVTWMPSYGAEVRGGTAYSMAKISKEEIASCVIGNPTILIVMNKPSLLKYENSVAPGGVLIVNKSMVDELPRRKDIKVVNIPMTEIALKLGNVKCANMIAVGAVIKRSKTITLRNVLSALKESLKGKEDLFQLNKSAVEKGYRL